MDAKIRDAMTAEFDLGGRVGIRLLDASPEDAAVIERQVGPIGARLDRDPDLTIRFVDHLEDDGPLRYLGHEEAGWTGDRYVILRGRQKSTIRVAIPMDRIGGPCEIVCERGIPAVPLLIPIINLTALARGLIPIHACAFVHDGRGVLALGWSKGGKSETLLAFSARGAAYVGDEWVYLDPERRWLRGLPEPMRVWDWQLRAMPTLGARVPPGARRRLSLLRAGVGGLRALGSLPGIRRRAPGRIAARSRVVLERQLSVQIPPDRLFDRVESNGCRLDALLLVVSHEPATVEVDVADPGDVARRATESFLFEMLDLVGHYRRFRFAFPDRRNPRLEHLGEDHRAALVPALAGVPTLEVRHPYPLELDRLFDAVAPRLG